MAEGPRSISRKKRVRKAPTLREQAEMARAKEEKEQEPKRRRIRRLTSKTGRAFRKTHLGNNPISKALAKIGRLILKVLRFFVPKYFINSWREVRLVTWPSRKETWRLTGAVFVFALIFGAMVAGVDKGLDILFKNLVLKQ